MRQPRNNIISAAGDLILIFKLKKITKRFEEENSLVCHFIANQNYLLFSPSYDLINVLVRYQLVKVERIFKPFVIGKPNK